MRKMRNFIGLKVRYFSSWKERFDRIYSSAVKINDTSSKKSDLVENLPDYSQDQPNVYSLNQSAVKTEIQSIIMNIE